MGQFDWTKKIILKATTYQQRDELYKSLQIERAGVSHNDNVFEHGILRTCFTLEEDGFGGYGHIGTLPVYGKKSVQFNISSSATNGENFYIIGQLFESKQSEVDNDWWVLEPDLDVLGCIAVLEFEFMFHETAGKSVNDMVFYDNNGELKHSFPEAVRKFKEIYPETECIGIDNLIQEAKKLRSENWRSKGLCFHCGGNLGLFKKCKSCGNKN